MRFRTAAMKPGCVGHLEGERDTHGTAVTRAHGRTCRCRTQSTSATTHRSITLHLNVDCSFRRASSRHKWFRLEPVVVHEKCGYCNRPTKHARNHHRHTTKTSRAHSPARMRLLARRHPRPLTAALPLSAVARTETRRSACVAQSDGTPQRPTACHHVTHCTTARRLPRYARSTHACCSAAATFGDSASSFRHICFPCSSVQSPMGDLPPIAAYCAVILGVRRFAMNGPCTASAWHRGAEHGGSIRCSGGIPASAATGPGE
jgi:hypothetical protein